MAYDAENNQLYSGSQDGSLKLWDCSTAQCKTQVDVGGEVDSLWVGKPFLIVGLHNKEEGMIKVWNTQTGHQHILTGHKGQVLAMTVAGSLLFSGGQDCSIRVWSFNQQAGIFMTSAIITKDQDGHSSGVLSLTSLDAFLFSGDRTGVLKVWDLNTGKCVQTLKQAHGAGIMQMLIWESHLLTASLDGNIKVWEVFNPPVSDMVIRPEARFVFTPALGEQSDQQSSQRQRSSHPSSQVPGVVAMYGTLDAQSKPVLLVSCSGDSCVRLFELPTLQPRGVLPRVDDARSLSALPMQVIFSGDCHGAVKVFQWKPGT